MTTQLGPTYRAETLLELDGHSFDVAIIGGGITGVGCALDAASRGLSVALIEQRDLGSGTSSRSSKLIHGGLRYLEQLSFRLVREALHERELLLQSIAPHLVWPIPFIYPLKHRIWERAYVALGISVYDGLAKLGHSTLPHQRHLGKKDLKTAFPSVKAGEFVGGIRYYDAGTDDARLVVAVARTAAGMGAKILTSARVTGFGRDGDGRVDSIEATCLESGRELNIGASVVINATGVWTDATEMLVGDVDTDVTASKGIHILVPKSAIDSTVGIITKTKSSVLFLIPRGEFWIIGTTDTPWELDLAHPAASERDIEYLLEQANRILERPLTPDDVIGVFAGLRPLVTGNAESTAKLSREHSITEPVPGLITVAGGKLTTYRVMARDTVDRVCDAANMRVPESKTDQIALVGATGYSTMKSNVERLGSQYGLSETEVKRLLRRYGSEATTVLELAASDPMLARQIPSGPYLGAEVRFAVDNEAALHLDDVLTRRTRLSIECEDRGTEGAEFVASIMAPLLDWDQDAVDREIVHYVKRVQAERESQTKPDDQTADAARLGAPDIRTLGA
ncbi:MAG: glycerol-3-phosphate dehydrogenase/oxidase [Acidimicrobiia bacterium]|nr:MAG: glycerol-3-phosphate dehydrogenase/oxidase [Acidimicrobiia bacterium]